MKTRTFAAIGAALIVGFLSGSLNASTPDVKAPHQCAVMATVAEKAFVDYENQVVAIHNRATRGQAEFAKHDGDVAQLWDAIDAAKTDHRVAKASCLGGAS